MPRNGLLGQKLKCKAQTTDARNSNQGTTAMDSRSSTTFVALDQEEANNDSAVRFESLISVSAHRRTKVGLKNVLTPTTLKLFRQIFESEMAEDIQSAKALLSMST